MTPTHMMKSLGYSSRVLVCFAIIAIILACLPDTESRKVSRYNRKEFREYLAAKRRADEEVRRNYYQQVNYGCPQGFYKAIDGRCYLSVPNVNRFQSQKVVHHTKPQPSTKTWNHYGHYYKGNPFQHNQLQRFVRSPEQHGRHRFGHPIPEAHRQKREPQQHGRHRFGHPIPEAHRQKREPLQHGRHRYGHPIPEARRQRREPQLQHGRHRFGHPIPENRS